MYNFTITDEPFARGFLGIDTDCLEKKVANGILTAAKTSPIKVDEALGLPDAWFGDNSTGMSYANGIFLNWSSIDSQIENHPEQSDEYRYIKKEFEKINFSKRIELCFTDQEKDIINRTAGWGGTWAGHAVPSLVNIAKYGTDGLRETVKGFMEKNPDKHEFYEGLLIYLDAVDVLGKRIHDLAVEALEKNDDEKQKKKLLRLASSFESCPKTPAKNFADACAVYVMLFTNDGIDSPGRFDQYMIEFWRNTPYAEAREMLEDMWEFFHKTRSWNLCISGSDENWNDVTNELSYEILDVTAKFKYQTPNLTMRCHRNTPEKLLYAAAKTIATGCGMPTLYNDEAVCVALERLGIPPCDSHLYCMNGCNQIDIQGKSHMGLEDGEINMGKAVELAFNDGKCVISGKQLGAHTGDASKFDSYEQFYGAVRDQLRYLAMSVCGMSNKAQLLYFDIMANPLRSLTIEGCLEKGLDYKHGGPLYGNAQILLEGVADCIDSVCAVKKFVFDEKKFTMAEMTDAVLNDFEGHEELLATVKKSSPHFGNDDDYVDEIGKAIVDDINTFLLNIPTVRGGFFGGGCSPFTRAASNGGATGALPYGKRKGECLYADSIGAIPGNDVNGPTALLKSCLKFDHTLPTSGFILNIKFDRDMFNTENGINAFLSLYHAYFDNKAQNLSVTVVSRDELLDAKIHPENHRDLIVRVGGYSDYFVNLPASLQDNVIARTNNNI